jgi:putative effector of murein hydrolase
VILVTRGSSRSVDLSAFPGVIQFHAPTADGWTDGVGNHGTGTIPARFEKPNEGVMT